MPESATATASKSHVFCLHFSQPLAPTKSRPLQYPPLYTPTSPQTTYSFSSSYIPPTDFSPTLSLCDPRSSYASPYAPNILQATIPPKSKPSSYTSPYTPPITPATTIDPRTMLSSVSPISISSTYASPYLPPYASPNAPSHALHCEPPKSRSGPSISLQNGSIPDAATICPIVQSTQNDFALKPTQLRVIAPTPGLYRSNPPSSSLLQNDANFPYSPHQANLGGQHQNPGIHPRVSISTLSANSTMSQPQLNRNNNHGKPSPISTPIRTLPKGEFLTFAMLLIRYSNHRPEHFSSKKLFDNAHKAWLSQLGLVGSHYRNWYYVQSGTQQQIELLWVEEPMEKRREVEKLAVRVKYNVLLNIHSIPLRLPPNHSNKFQTMPFTQLEQRYFNTPSRNILNQEDYVKERRWWTAELGLTHSLYEHVCSTPEETASVNAHHEMKHLTERAAIEAQAKFLKLVLTDIRPWMSFEDQFAIYPTSCIASFELFVQKRLSWLSRLGLDFWPFSFYNITDKYNECAEVAWCEFSDARRAQIETLAEKLKHEDSPFLHDWSEVKGTFGFSLEADFDGNITLYVQQNASWLARIGMSDKDVDAKTLEQMWKKKSVEEKQKVIARARYEKEKFFKDMR